MNYQLDYEDSVGKDCPKCRHGLVLLSEYDSIERHEGYVVDDDDDSFHVGMRTMINPTRLLVRGVIQAGTLLYRNVLRPKQAQIQGEKKKAIRAETLRVFPKSLICPNCEHVVRDK